MRGASWSGPMFEVCLQDDSAGAADLRLDNTLEQEDRGAEI